MQEMAMSSAEMGPNSYDREGERLGLIASMLHLLGFLCDAWFRMFYVKWPMLQVFSGRRG
jgi:hypothetical protein